MDLTPLHVRRLFRRSRGAEPTEAGLRLKAGAETVFGLLREVQPNVVNQALELRVLEAACVVPDIRTKTLPRPKPLALNHQIQPVSTTLWGRRFGAKLRVRALCTPRIPRCTSFVLC